MKKKKLTFFCNGEDIFLRDIISNLRGEYDIKFYQRGTEKEFYNMLHDTDIAWFEWSNEMVEKVMSRPKMCERYIVRLHSYEMFTPIPSRIDWSKVDDLIFVSEKVCDLSLKKFQIDPKIARIIYNGVDIEKFTIPKNKEDTKKIAFIGFINYKKGPEILLQAFKAIYDYDPSFEFHIAGDFQDERIALYFNNIKKHMPFEIKFDGWVADINKYLEDKSYIISSSLFESFQYSIAEGMAKGCVPLVHSWAGSELIYPVSNIWTWPDECVNIIKDFEKAENKKEIRAKLRKHIVRCLTSI